MAYSRKIGGGKMRVICFADASRESVGAWVQPVGEARGRNFAGVW